MLDIALDTHQREVRQIENWIKSLMSHYHFLRRVGANHLIIENEAKIKEYVKEIARLKEEFARSAIGTNESA